MNPELKILLQKAFARTRRVMWIVAIISIALGVFMAYLYGIDTEISNGGLAISILYLIVTGFFVLVGVLMIYVVNFKIAAQHNALLHVLQTDPTQLKKVYSLRVVNKISNTDAANPVGAQHFIRFELQNGKLIQVSFSFDQIAFVLTEIYKIAPQSQCSENHDILINNSNTRLS